MARTKDAGPKPRNDAYTGLLAISFLALVGATVLMAMDAEHLGKPPEKLKIDAPGGTFGKQGEGLRRPDVGKGDAGAPIVPPAGPEKKDPVPGTSKAEPRALPPLPELTAADAPATVVPVKAEADAPPLPVPSFVPPM